MAGLVALVVILSILIDPVSGSNYGGAGGGGWTLDNIWGFHREQWEPVADFSFEWPSRQRIPEQLTAT